MTSRQRIGPQGHGGLGASRISVALLAVLALSPVVGSAQSGTGSQFATRGQLREQLSKAEKEVVSARSGDRAKATDVINRLRQRLDSGDFKPGDRFVAVIRQDSVRADTLVVRDSLLVAVLNLPEFSVRGVLRAELEERLSTHVSRFLRNAQVRTTQLVRVSVTGAVRNPGFYYALPDRPLNDLLTSAGGPLMEADLNKVTVSRVGRALLNGSAARKAVEEGRTLEALDIQGGDVVHVPSKRRIDWRSVIQIGFLLMSLTLGVLNFLRWYYAQQDQ